MQKLHRFLLVSFICLSESHDQCLLWLTLIGLNRSHDLNNFAMQFSTQLSSSVGIIY